MSGRRGALTETASLPLAVTVDAVRACERLPGLLSAVHQQVLPMLAGLFSDARFSMIVDEIETIVLEVWTKEDPEAAFEKLAQFDKRWTLESPGQRWGGSLVVATRLV